MSWPDEAERDKTKLAGLGEWERRNMLELELRAKTNGQFLTNHPVYLERLPHIKTPNVPTTYQANSTSSGDTEALAAKLAPLVTGGAVIELASDLGGGKTTFIQGLVKALGYDGAVTSPTFTLSNVYNLSGRTVHHYDLYRLGEAGVVGDELAEDLADPTVITVIEWAGVAEPELPSDRLRVEIEVTGETERRFRFSGGGPASAKVIEGLKS